MEPIKISVIIPFYNTPKKLFVECLESVKKLDPYEIILVDDCSTDVELINIAKRSGCLCLKTPYQSGHDGIPFNLGVRKAKGEYICRVDSDDILLEIPSIISTDIHFGNVERVKMPPSFNIKELILAPRAICSGIVIKREVLLLYPLVEESTVFNDVLLVLRLLHNNHTYDRHAKVNYIYRKREGSIQTSKPLFYHRLRHIQTVARFCQLEDVDPKLSIYYLELAMMNVKFGSNSLKLYKEFNEFD